MLFKTISLVSTIFNNWPNIKQCMTRIVSFKYFEIVKIKITSMCKIKIIQTNIRIVFTLKNILNKIKDYFMII